MASAISRNLLSVLRLRKSAEFHKKYIGSPGTALTRRADAIPFADPGRAGGGISATNQNLLQSAMIELELELILFQMAQKPMLRD